MPDPTSSSPGQSTDDGRGRIFPCEECGADLVFDIGQQSLTCPYCGTIREIDLSEDSEITEQDFQNALERLKKQRLEQHPDTEKTHNAVRCESCGADVVFEGTLTSTECPYCGSPIQREKVHSGGFRLPVDGILPFQVDERRAASVLSAWVKSRWFAPNDFKKQGAKGRFNGVYLPFWTYDTLTFTRYRGERGEDYTVTVGTGKNRRTETRTKWYPVAGRFQRFFDDVLVNATRNLPVQYIDQLSPWPLHNCQTFSQQFLAGYFSRTYDIELDDGFQTAQKQIEDALHSDACRRIGGDRQRIHQLQCRYDAITYKHLLLPVWMLAYRYKGKSFHVFVNAVTGEVQGERPYSWVKILLTALAAIIAVMIVIGVSR